MSMLFHSKEKKAKREQEKILDARFTLDYNMNRLTTMREELQAHADKLEKDVQKLLEESDKPTAELCSATLQMTRKHIGFIDELYLEITMRRDKFEVAVRSGDIASALKCVKGLNTEPIDWLKLFARMEGRPPHFTN